MFLGRHMQDGGGNDYLPGEFVACLRDRKNSELSACFNPAGLMRVSDCETGAPIEEGRGREGVESLARSIHENVALVNFRTSHPRRIAGGVDYAWTAVLRNWGCGPEQAASGRVRIEFGGDGILCANLMLDRDVWFALVRPGA